MGFLSSLFGVKDRTPKTETVIQAQKLPEEISPFVKEILKEAKDLFEADKARGYDPYTGETIAPLTPEEEAAMAGIAGLAGTTQPFLEEAVETYRTGAEKFTPEAAEEYMSPYQRAVTDIEKREAQRQFEKNVMPRFEAEAISAGGLSGLGTRAGVEAAELQRGQSQLLADIEAKGLQSAYQDARLGFEQQKAREQQMAANIGRTGPAMFQAGLAEQGALQTVGEQKRQLGQSALDEAYYRFLEEQQFPQRTLSQYSGTVYGNPLAGMPTKTTTTTGLPGAPSMGQQLLGMGLSGLNIYGMGTQGFSSPFAAKNIFKQEGGPVIKAQNGTGPGSRLSRGTAGQPPGWSRFSPQGKYKDAQAKIKELQEKLRVKEEIIRDPEGNIITEEELQAQISGPEKLPSVSTMKDLSLSPLVKVAQTKEKITKPSGGRGNINPPRGTWKSASDKLPDHRRREEGLLGELIRGAYQRPDGKIGAYPIDEISGGIIRAMDVRPNIEKKIKEKETLLARDPKFDVALQRRKGQKGIADTLNIMRTSISEREKVQKEGYEEESKATKDFLDKQQKLVEELGGYPGDIIGEALDQGMDQPTIATMLTKTLNLSAKGLGKRKKEINKELRSLNKNKFELEKEERKGKRTDKLANLEKKEAVALKGIAAKLGLEKQLEQLPYDMKQEARDQLIAVSNMEGTEIDKTAKSYDILTKLINAHAAMITAKSKEDDTTTVDAPKGADFNALRNDINEILKTSIIDEEAGTIGGKPMQSAQRKRLANIRTMAQLILAGQKEFKPYGTGAVAARAFANAQINKLGSIQ